MRIYNSLTKQKEEFIPVKSGEVKIYMCGPTVYDYFHIGNARSFVYADIIHRYLVFKGYNVDFVMNLTDIDDKIIKKANEDNVDSKYISEKFSRAFFEDIEKLKIKPAAHYPKATEHIKEIIELIKTIEDKGYAYNINGDVFFEVTNFKDYGKLSGKNIDDLESGARVEINETKKNPLDFALWKKAKVGEPSWDSPWGKGRPGWHIECSAMSTKILGDTFDIHAGGSDLIFPHHENEIAQHCAAKGSGFAKYWIHFGFLNIQNEKMSKSLGNFFTAREVLNKYSAETIRLFFAQTHYSGPLNFSDNLLDAAKKGLEKISNLFERLQMQINRKTSSSFIPEFDFNKFEIAFTKAMDDDFNSPQAVAAIFDFVRECNSVLAVNENISKEFLISAYKFLIKTAGDVIGILDISGKGNLETPNLEDELIGLLIEIRSKMKLEKHYEIADFIRNELEKMNIALKDTKTETTFKKLK